MPDTSESESITVSGSARSTDDDDSASLGEEIVSTSQLTGTSITETRKKSTKRKTTHRPASPYLQTFNDKSIRTQPKIFHERMQQPGIRSARDYWLSSLKSQGKGLSGATTPFKAFANGSGTNNSSSDYLKVLMGASRVVGKHRRAKSSTGLSSKHAALDGNYTSRPSSAGAAGGHTLYRSAEEYYDEILELKKMMVALQSENVSIKTRLKRAEDEITRKDKTIEEFLSTPQTNHMGSTLVDKSRESATKLTNLKQRLFKVEQQLREKEAALAKLQGDIKVTKMTELSVQLEEFYGEILRLRKLSAREKDVELTRHTETKLRESCDRIKQLNEELHRMSSDKERLARENHALLLDVEKARQHSFARSKDGHNRYSKMSRQDLLVVVQQLESRLQRMDDSVKSESVESTKGKATKRNEHNGKVALSGPVSQRLDQLDKRETELLEERAKLLRTNKKLKEDRIGYQDQLEDRKAEIKFLKDEVACLQAELNDLHEQNKQKQSRHSAGREALSLPKSRTPTKLRKPKSPLARNSIRPDSGSDSEGDPSKSSVQGKTQNNVGLQSKDSTPRSSRKAEHRGSVPSPMQYKDRRRSSVKSRHDRNLEDSNTLIRVGDFQKKRAANKIQREWKDYQRRKQNDKAAVLIQSALRGHLKRRHSPDVGLSKSDSETMPVTTIQAAVRGHLARSEQVLREAFLSDSNDIDKTRRSSTRRRSSFDGMLQSKFTGRKASLRLEDSFPAPARTNAMSTETESSEEASDDDDDVVMP